MTHQKHFRIWFQAREREEEEEERMNLSNLEGPLTTFMGEGRALITYPDPIMLQRSCADTDGNSHDIDKEFQQGLDAFRENFKIKYPGYKPRRKKRVPSP